MRRLLFLCSVFAAAIVANAQQKGIEAVFAEHPELLAGSDYLCPADPIKLTPAPKGYKPLFITHYGRHGARYAWQDDMYEWIREVFEKAEGDANLTQDGKEFNSKFEILYPDVRYRVGDLSRKGFEQQNNLASRMYSNFPGIFKKDAKVRAWTSTNTRCVMTMSAFCLGLKARNPQLDIFENFGRVFLPAIIPQNSSNPFRDKNYETTPLSLDETWEQYIDRTVDYKSILDRLFVDRDKALPERQWNFVSYLYFFVLGMNNLDSDLDFTAVFTPEEQVQLYKINAFHFYTKVWPIRFGYLPILRDIISKADERIEKGEKGADLRFGHDYALLPLLMILNVNGMGREAHSGDEIPEICPLYNVPMGANLQFVFYTGNKKEVLFKMLLNGQEATLPMETESWPYYKWSDFKAQYGNL